MLSYPRNVAENVEERYAVVVKQYYVTAAVKNFTALTRITRLDTAAAVDTRPSLPTEGSREREAVRGSGHGDTVRRRQ